MEDSSTISSVGIIGLGYVFAIEGFLSNLPGKMQVLTIQYYLRAVDDQGATELDPPGVLIGAEPHGFFVGTRSVAYATDFDGLSLGPTQPQPGAAGHDGWYSALAVAPAYGEIQDAVAVSGNALHEFTGIANPGPGEAMWKWSSTISGPSGETYGTRW